MTPRPYPDGATADAHGRRCRLQAHWFDDTGWAAELVDGWDGELMLARRWFPSAWSAGQWLARLHGQLPRRRLDQLDGLVVEPPPTDRGTVVAHRWPGRGLDVRSLAWRALVTGRAAFSMDADAETGVSDRLVPFAPTAGEHRFYAAWPYNRAPGFRRAWAVEVTVEPGHTIHVVARIGRPLERLHPSPALDALEAAWASSSLRRPRPTDEWGPSAAVSSNEFGEPDRDPRAV